MRGHSCKPRRQARERWQKVLTPEQQWDRAAQPAGRARNILATERKQQSQTRRSAPTQLHNYYKQPRRLRLI
jgi:hypothetical protein